MCTDVMMIKMKVLGRNCSHLCLLGVHRLSLKTYLRVVETEATGVLGHFN